MEDLRRASLFTGRSTLLLARLGPPLHACAVRQNADFTTLKWCIGSLVA